MAIEGYTTRGTVQGLDPEFSKRLLALIEANPRLKALGPPLLNDLYRSPEQQVEAINSVAKRNGLSFVDYSRGIPGKAAGVVMDASGKPVASKSMHGRGLAADFNWSNIAPEDRAWLHSNAGRFGLVFPQTLRKSDPLHIQIADGYTPASGGTGGASGGAVVASAAPSPGGASASPPAGGMLASLLTQPDQPQGGFLGALMAEKQPAPVPKALQYLPQDEGDEAPQMMPRRQLDTQRLAAAMKTRSRLGII